ncbi:MAG: DUF1643 domain-containing protein [Campylobacterales bacterium]|nr:DUF1643 domain-containing protein [Campylobacterales bacterium]
MNNSIKSKLNIFEYDKIDENLEYRYLLGIKGDNPLYCIGMNPSTALPTRFDQTVLKVFGLALVHGYDSCVMMNLLPIMETNSSKVTNNNHKKYLEKNINHIVNIVNNDILVCWGDKISQNSNMKDSFFSIYDKLKDKKIEWLCIDNEKEDLLLTQQGNPRHPSRIYNFRELKYFNIHEYYNSMKN